MRVINTERILLGSYIVSQNEIKLVIPVSHSCDRCYRVMGLAVCLCKYERSFVCITAPCCQYLVSKINNSFLVGAAEPYNRHRPFNYTCRNILIAPEAQLRFDRSLCHSKGIVAALEMLVRKNRSAHYRQISI